jgi:hypothetical protein
MNNNDEKYTALIKKLSLTKPRPIDEEALTATIMEAILRKPQQSNRIILWMRPIIATAAVFLLGLYIYQQSDSEIGSQSNTLIHHPQMAFSKENYDCNFKSESEKYVHKSLFSQYLCYLKHNQSEKAKSKLFLLSQISRYQRKHSMTFN